MPPPEREKDRERRIYDEAVVDAHDEEERAMGWYYYLENKMRFPFSGRCREVVSTSPLKVGEEVKVKSLASADVCERDMFVTVAWDGRSLDVPLRQILSADTDEDMEEAIGDWHYWVACRYQF